MLSTISKLKYSKLKYNKFIIRRHYSNINDQITNSVKFNQELIEPSIIKIQKFKRTDKAINILFVMALIVTINNIIEDLNDFRKNINQQI